MRKISFIGVDNIEVFILKNVSHARTKVGQLFQRFRLSVSTLKILSLKILHKRSS